MVDDAILKQLFTSTARVDLMSYFFRNADKEIYMSMLKTELGKNLSTYQKELDNLVKMQFLHERRKANLRIFSLNTSFVLFSELRRIFFKTKLMPHALEYKMRKSTEIEYAFLYEKSVNGINRNLMFVVSNDSADIVDLSNIIAGLIKELGFRLEFNIYRRSDVKRLVGQGDDLVAYALNAEKSMVKEG